METKKKKKKNEKPVCRFCDLPILEDHIVTKMVGSHLPPVKKKVPEGSLVLFRNTPNTRDMLRYDIGDLDDNDFERKFRPETPYHRRCYDVISAKNFALRTEKSQRGFIWDLEKKLQKQQE